MSVDLPTHSHTHNHHAMCIASDCWAMLGPWCIPMLPILPLPNIGIGFMDCMPWPCIWFMPLPMLFGIPRQPMPFGLGEVGMPGIPLPPCIGIAMAGPLPPRPSVPDIPLPPGWRFCPLGAWRWRRIGVERNTLPKSSRELEYTPEKDYKNHQFWGSILVFGGCNWNKKQVAFPPWLNLTKMTLS